MGRGEKGRRALEELRSHWALLARRAAAGTSTSRDIAEAASRRVLDQLPLFSSHWYVTVGLV